MIGIDLVDISKFKEKISKPYFVENVFTKGELSYALSKQDFSETLAGIFAVKEAAIKTYDLNLSYILRKKIEICHGNSRPYLIINSKKANADISISHDNNYAIGICISKVNMRKQIDANIAKIFPARNEKSHKGHFGRIGVLGGSPGMSGSVFMSSMASLRTGAGLSFIISPKSIGEILEIKTIEQIVKQIDCENFYYDEIVIKQILKAIGDLDILVIGPGMGRGYNLYKVIGEIIKKTKIPLIIDADGLNALSNDLSILKPNKNIILTPHLGEFSRLTGLSIKDINKDRLNLAKNFAKKNGIILVLKSENTIVTDGYNYYINKIGNPGMATAGSGDVLTGVIATLAYKLKAYKAAKLGVYLHSLAGDIAKENLGEDSLLARDIIEYLPRAIRELRSV